MAATVRWREAEDEGAADTHPAAEPAPPEAAHRPAAGRPGAAAARLRCAGRRTRGILWPHLPPAVPDGCEPQMILADIDSLIDDNADLIHAVVIFAIALAAAKLVDFFMARSARRITGRLARDELSQATVTRLRLVRRLVFALIVLIGLGAALWQIDALRPLANTLLASSAVLGIVVGLAARSPLANALAGVMLATVQPFRIGDVIEWNGNRGRVEDITFTYTFVRLPSGHRLVVPNETIAASPLENFTIAGNAVEADASVWVTPPHANTALALLRERLGEMQVNLGECLHDRIELKIGFETAAEHEAKRRIEVREQAVAILGAADMLEAPAG